MAALDRQLRKLGTSFDRETLVTTSRRKRKQPQRFNGYVFRRTAISISKSNSTHQYRNDDESMNQVNNYYIGDCVSVKWKDNVGYKGTVTAVRRKRNRSETIDVEYEQKDGRGRVVCEEDVKVSRVSLIHRGKKYQQKQDEKERIKIEKKKIKASKLKVDVPELGEIVEILWKEDDGSEWWYVAVVTNRNVEDQRFVAYFPHENSVSNIYKEGSIHEKAGQLKFRTALFQGGTYVNLVEGRKFEDICRETGWNEDHFKTLNQCRLKGLNSGIRLKKHVVLLTPAYPKIIPYVKVRKSVPDSEVGCPRLSDKVKFLLSDDNNWYVGGEY